MYKQIEKVHRKKDQFTNIVFLCTVSYNLKIEVENNSICNSIKHNKILRDKLTKVQDLYTKIYKTWLKGITD